MHNFGAGDIIEIAPPAGSTLLLPFSNAVVPTVDVKGGRVIIELPAEIEGDERDDDDDGEESEAASAPSARGPRERGDP
jgi:16S rRNA processing protein RimM